MADISALGNQQPVEVLDLENYAVNRKSSFSLPVKGRYTVQAPDAFPAESFSRSRKGALAVDISPTIVGPVNDGFKLRFIKIYNSTWQRDGKVVSQIGDYLAANGVKAVLKDEQAIADAVESTANRTYEVDIDWRANRNGFEVKGMENFPKNPDGSYQSWVSHPTEKAEDGTPKRVFANLEVVRYVAAA